MTRAATPSRDPPGPSLLQEAQWFLSQEWNLDWLVDNTGAAGRQRWAMAGLVCDRILALSRGLQDAVHEMCKLEKRQNEWFFDPNGYLFKILEGSQAKHLLYDDFLALRERVRKAVEMLRYRVDLHSGNAPLHAPSSSASEIYLPEAAGSPRTLLDLHLAKPSLRGELTAEYAEQLRLRQEGLPRDSKLNDQSHRWEPSRRSYPNVFRTTEVSALERAFRPDTPEDARARSLQAPSRPFAAKDADPPPKEVRDPPPSPPPRGTERELPFPSEPVASASRAFPAHPTFAEQVRRAAYPTRGEPPLSYFRGEPFARPSVAFPERRAARAPAGDENPFSRNEARSSRFLSARGREPEGPDPNGDPSDDGSDSPNGDREPRRGRSRGRRPSGRRRREGPSPSPLPPSSPPRGGSPAVEPNRGTSDALLTALKLLFPDGLPKSLNDSHEPRMNMKYDRTSVPKWDGKSSTLVHYLHEMNYLASLNPRMSHDLAVLAPQRFTGFAQDWWLIQEEQNQILHQKDWKSMLEGIRAQFFTQKFMDDLRDEYDQQKFRQKGHEKETPSEFVVRRLLLHRYLPMGSMTERQEIAAVSRRVPSLWKTVLNIDAIETIAALLQQVQDKSEDLLCITALTRSTDTVAADSRTKESVSSWSNRRTQSRPRRAFAAVVDGSAPENSDPTRDSFSENLTALESVSAGGSADGDPDEDLFIAPLAAAAQVRTNGPPGANRRRPPEGYAFARNDSVVSRKLPPSPCKCCGSEKHWDRECPHWEEFLISRAKRALAAEKDISPEEDREYVRAYVNYVTSRNDSSVSALSKPEAERLPEKEVYGARSIEMETINEYKPTDGYLPRESPHVLLSVAEAERLRGDTAALADLLETAIGAADGYERDHSFEAAEASRVTRGAATAATRSPLEEDPPARVPEPTVNVVKVPASRRRPPGSSSLGISALSVPIRLSSVNAPDIVARVDSGADISLISEECWKGIPEERRPKRQRGLRMKLFQLTNGFYIDGFVKLPVFLEADNGDWLQLEAECYVVPCMTSPILLGEDFQVNYELGVHRRVASDSTLVVPASGHSITASSSSTPLARQFSIIGRGAASNFVRAKSHRRNKAKRRRARSSSSNQAALALADVNIPPHSCKRIAVANSLPSDADFLVEKTVLGQADGSCLLTTPTLMNKEHPWVTVTNPSDRPRRVCRGEALGLMHRADEWFQREDPTLRAHATAVAAFVRNQAESDQGVPTQESSDEAWGPNTAEAPDPSVYPSEKLEDILDIGPDWPPEERARLLEVLHKRERAFAFDGRLGHNPTEVEIKVPPGTRPISLPMYAASPAKREVIDKQHDAWMALDVIEPSLSPWAAPVLIAYRNGKPRFCVDYRRLNAVTVADEFPIPRQTEILQALSGAQVLSSLDALSGFTQLSVAEADREKTAFRTHRGLFQFRRLPFGLRNGPSAFQRVMQGVLAPYLWLFALVYIDDIVIYSKNWQEHVDHVDKVLEAIIASGITLSPPKCHFGYSSILLLGQKVSRLGFSTHEEKVKAVEEFARPSRVSELQSFLGMAVYFSNYIPYYSFLASPLFQLLRKGAAWEWTAECEHAWTSIKEALKEAPVLAHAEPGQAYRLYTDASDVALGACLQQVQLMRVLDLKGTKAYDRLARAYAAGEAPPTLVTRLSNKTDDTKSDALRGWGATLDESLVAVERVVAYWSRTCKPAERNYSATEREALAAKEGLVHFLPFIEGERVTLVTDHAALQWARTFENANRRLAAWGAVFSAFAPLLEIVHRPGRAHSNVDPLSRIPRKPPPHDSPLKDSSESITPEAGKMETAEARATTFPAPRTASAAALRLSWDEVLEDPPVFAFAHASEDAEAERTPPAHASQVQTRARTRAKNRGPVTGNRLPEFDDSSPETSETSHIYLDDDIRQRFVDGYLEDPHFAEKWKKVSETEAQPFYGQCFVKEQDGLLYLRINDETPKLCVPKSMIPFVLARVHDAAWDSAHEGARKFSQRLQRRFHWSTLRKDAEAFTKSCDVCQKTKVDRRARTGWLRPNPVPGRPFEWVSMDLITGLPSSAGFDAIFVAVCRLTKYALCVPCHSTLNTVEFAKLFVDQVILRHGLPEHLISDRDPRWTSEFWRAVARELNLHLSLSSSHHPQHDGQTEIVNQTIETMLRAFIGSERSEWARWLPFVCHAYNTSVHSSTGYSPHFLLYGKEAAGELDVISHSARAIPRPQGALDHAANFLHDFAYHRERAREALATAQELAARAYNKGRRQEIFEPGDSVLVNPHSLELVDVKGTGKKLVQRMLGPFKVQERINPLVYKLALPDTYPMNPVINIQHLRKYHEDASGAFEGVQRHRLPDPRRSDILASFEWEVERIVGWRRNPKRGNRMEYLLRWKGFGPTEDSWASEFDLRNAQEILRDFLRSSPRDVRRLNLDQNSS